MFDLKFKIFFEVCCMEVFWEKLVSVEYNLGFLDGIWFGIFYIFILDVMKYNIYLDEFLFLYEVIFGYYY